MSKRKPSGADRELRAMSAILAALEELDGESIQRVLDYVLGRLSLNRTSTRSFGTASSPSAIGGSLVAGPAAADSAPGRRASIRDLKEEKRPDSANQMAALVAYYLSELAPEVERAEAINTADIEKYFKQAGFRLPKTTRSALPNAAAAGYFDSIGGGRYRLNPVGYNLVVHGLPPSGEGRKTSPRRKKKAASKGRK